MRRRDVPGEGDYHMGIPTHKELRKKYGSHWYYGDDEYLCGVFGKRRMVVEAVEVPRDEL